MTRGIKRFAILEGREAIGGTWDLFRYPGIRSDSDIHTLGYNFKPWLEAKSIANGSSILKYVNETADENGIREHIRFQQQVKVARWVLQIDRPGTGEQTKLSCNFPP